MSKTITNLSVERAGDKIILPDGMSWDEGIEWLKRKKDEAEREVAISAPISGYHPLDVAAAFHKALANLYGWTALIPTPGFFGSNPPAFMTIPTGPNGESIQVPWGRLKVPNIAGHLQTNVGAGLDGRPTFILSGTTKQKDMVQVDRIVKEIREVLLHSSIFRSKALRVEFDPDNPMRPPDFMDLTGINREGLVFSKWIEELVDTTLWTPIRETEAARRAHIPLKRGFLLEGPYGNGKTLCARVTALEAVQNGWTFIYIEKIQDLKQALEFARMYQPAVVFAEDVDRVDDGSRSDPFNEILNTIDGVEYKKSEIFTILTTNHVERLHKSMLRPGRLDVVVEVRPPDAEAATRLLRLYAGELLDPQTDLTEAGKLFAGKSPAILNEVVQRAKLANLRRGESPLLSGDDFLVSIRSLQPQLVLLEGEAEKTIPPVEKALEQVGKSMTRELENRVAALEDKF